jgi:uncharacterized lipoprotein YddW (UPF0748 family)
MSRGDWDWFESLAARFAGKAPTRARAHGLALSSLIHTAQAAQPEPRPPDWMDWERRKTLRLVPSLAPQPDPAPLEWMDWERRKTLRLLLPET